MPGTGSGWRSDVRPEDTLSEMLCICGHPYVQHWISDVGLAPMCAGCEHAFIAAPPAARQLSEMEVDELRATIERFRSFREGEDERRLAR